MESPSKFNDPGLNGRPFNKQQTNIKKSASNYFSVCAAYTVRCPTEDASGAAQVCAPLRFKLK